MTTENQHPQTYVCASSLVCHLNVELIIRNSSQALPTRRTTRRMIIDVYLMLISQQTFSINIII